MCLLVLFALKITLLLGTDLPVLRLVTTVSLIHQSGCAFAFENMHKLHAPS